MNWTINNPSVQLSATSGTEVTLTSPVLRDESNVTLTATSGTKTATCTVTILKDENIDASAQIMFPSQTSDKDNNSSISDWNTTTYPFLSGYSYISSTKFTNVYYGKKGYGLKLGKGSGTDTAGTLTLELNLTNLNNLNLASIDIYSSAWTDSNGKADETVFNISLYEKSDATAAIKTSTITPREGGTISLDAPVSISKIEISTSSSKTVKRAYLKGLTLNFYSVDAFALDLLNGVNDSCSYSENNNWANVSERLVPVWPTLITKYNYLTNDQKNTVLNTVALEDEDATNIQLAMAKYDHIILRYKSNDITDFIGRNPSAKSVSLIKSENNDFTLAMILLILSISTSLIGYFAFFRKRKLHN